MKPNPPAETETGKQPVSIDGSERVFLCGMTGSGKTYWAMHMLAALPRLVVIDLKGSDEIAKWEWNDNERDAFRKLDLGKPVRVRVRDDDKALEWMRAAYRAGGCVVYIDEIYALVPQGSRAPQELNAIWTRGRELGVGGWAATQRPSWVPREIISEAEWTVCFRLKLEDDRKAMANTMGKEVLQPITDEHGFYITRTNWPKVEYYRQLSTQIRLAPKTERAKEPV